MNAMDASICDLMCCLYLEVDFNFYISKEGHVSYEFSIISIPSYSLTYHTIPQL